MEPKAEFRSNTDTKEAHRFGFKLQVETIPGKAGARPITIANAFMQEHFGRDFSWSLDYCHTQANIDDKKGVGHLFLDVNSQHTPKPSTHPLLFKVKVKDEKM
jgi:hypothetical protein